MSQVWVYFCFVFLDLLILCRFFISWKELSIQQSSPSRVMFFFAPPAKVTRNYRCFSITCGFLQTVCMLSKLNIFGFEFFSVQSFKGISHSLRNSKVSWKEPPCVQLRVLDIWILNQKWSFLVVPALVTSCRLPQIALFASFFWWRRTCPWGSSLFDWIVALWKMPSFLIAYSILPSKPEFPCL